ncbi:hypothetical protein O3M35_008452 [Rhynocoris fuscipes]|uniref:Gustatory receptor n=1 Tax=Rhynocoris fuscipes TaxID=488301 RepID=A0AAW1D9U2_9HEMI
MTQVDINLSIPSWLYISSSEIPIVLCSLSIYLIIQYISMISLLFAQLNIKLTEANHNEILTLLNNYQIIHECCEKLNKCFGLPLIIFLIHIYVMISVYLFIISDKTDYWLLFALTNTSAQSIILLLVLLYQFNEITQMDKDFKKLIYMKKFKWVHLRKTLIASKMDLFLSKNPRIQFTAFDFVNLDSNLFATMISNILTYYIIFTQFN